MRALFLATLVCTGCAHPPRAPPLTGWRALHTPHLRLRTDLPPADARTTVEQLETLRAALQTAWSEAEETPGVTEAIVLRDGAELRTFTELTGIATLTARGPLLVTAGSPTSFGDLSPDRAVLAHEMAHDLGHRWMPGAPRWFDEGYATYAAGEWGRDEVLATNFALVLRGLPTLESLDAMFTGGASRAQQGYALAHRAVAEMAGLDRERGLTLFFGYWRETRSMDMALRRAYGLTQAEFELRWRSATRRRYGALALFADVTLAALFLLLLVGPLWVMRRQRDRRRLAVLRAADEAQERRERESALASLLGEVSPQPPAPGGGIGPPGGDQSQ
jgi:hypothetical protein